jgi:hypothetical protein
MPIRVAVLTLALLPLVAACKKREPIADQPVRPRGVLIDEPVAPSPVTPPATEPSYRTPTSAEDNPLPEIKAPPGEEQPPGTTTAAQAAPDDPVKPTRNLQTELESMMGSPVTCLAARTAKEAPSQITISLTANVMPSGAVGRGEVSAPGLSPDELSCVRSRLESLRFAQPVENAPRTVSGSISITLNRGS